MTIYIKNIFIVSLISLTMATSQVYADDTITVTGGGSQGSTEGNKACQEIADGLGGLTSLQNCEVVSIGDAGDGTVGILGINGKWVKFKCTVTTKGGKNLTDKQVITACNNQFRDWRR